MSAQTTSHSFHQTSLAAKRVTVGQRPELCAVLKMGSVKGATLECQLIRKGNKTERAEAVTAADTDGYPDKWTCLPAELVICRLPNKVVAVFAARCRKQRDQHNYPSGTHKILHPRRIAGSVS